MEQGRQASLTGTQAEPGPAGAEALLGATAAGPLGPPRKDPERPLSVLEADRLPSWKHYRDLRFQGQGGMGRIYRAFDPVLQREVALKFLARQDPTRLMRFVLEAQHQARVDHPNICKVYEVGDWNGQPYIAMQFIRGETLASARAQLTLQEMARVMETAAEAVHAAHRQGLIHRDLKPANIMVEREDRGLTPFVLDFGLARGLEATGLTQHGVNVGTAGFMAPEQITGTETKLGFHTDVYGLGATLYMLLAGDPPFLDSSDLEMLRRTAEEDPPPLSKVRQDVPADLETIVLKCMRKEPGERYPSALALAEDLRRFQAGEPILAHPPTLAYRTAKWTRKHRTLAWVTAGALAAVLTFAGLGLHARATAAAQARWAQRFGQEAERLEALLRYAHLLPAHDIRLELAQVRERMAQLERTAAKASASVAGPAEYALGRGFLAGGDLAGAGKHLAAAMAHGFQGPEVAHVYGRVLGLQYQAEMERILRITDPAIRVAEQRRAEGRFRGPAVAHLERGRGAALEAPEYDQALLFFYGARYDEALAAARAAFAKTPWLYEAKGLEGDILLQKAARVAFNDGTQALLTAAVACFQQARTLAPSDPSLYIREARAWRLAMDLGWSRGATPGEPSERGLELLDQGRRVDPARFEIPTLEAWFHLGRARHHGNRGTDGTAAVQAALDRTELALTLNPGNPEALQARMLAHSQLSVWLWFSGKNPLPGWELAIEAGNRARAAAGQDPQLLRGLANIHLHAMTYKAQCGQDYQASWEAAWALMEQGVKAFPEVGTFHFGLGAAWEEWAEQERIHGRDPARAVQEAVKALDHALQLDPGSADSLYYRGVTRMTQGEYQLQAASDPRPALEEALAFLSRALAIKADHESALRDRAECHLDLARAALEQDLPPWEALALARRSIAAAKAQKPTSTFADYQAARCDLVEVRWLLKHQPGTAPARLEALLARAEKHTRRWLKDFNDRVTWGQLAELYEWWAKAGTGNSRALPLGLQAARKAVAIDPSYGLGHYQLGKLEAMAARLAKPGKARDAAAARAEAAFALGARLDPTVYRLLGSNRKG